MGAEILLHSDNRDGHFHPDGRRGTAPQNESTHSTRDQSLCTALNDAPEQVHTEEAYKPSCEATELILPWWMMFKTTMELSGFDHYGLSGLEQASLGTLAGGTPEPKTPSPTHAG